MRLTLAAMFVFFIASNACADSGVDEPKARIAAKFSYFYDGNRLYVLYSSNRTAYLAYISGVYDSTRSKDYYCPPRGATLSQIGDVAAKYLEKEPESRDMEAHVLVVSAWEKAWPCPPDK